MLPSALCAQGDGRANPSLYLRGILLALFALIGQSTVQEVSMAVLLHQVAARNPVSGLWNAVIDTPKGSRNKYKYDEKDGLWRLIKVLPLHCGDRDSV